MHTFITVLRFIVHKLSFLLMSLFIFMFLLLVPFTTKVSDADSVKKWLQEADTYDLVLDNAFDLLQNSDEEEADSFIKDLDQSALDEDALIEAIKPAIGAQFLQEQTETVINAMYAWLNGDVEAPEFTVSFESKSDEIGQAIIDELERQVATYPECTDDDPFVGALDVTTVDCIPKGADLTESIERFVEVQKRDGILSKEFSFSSKDLKLDPEATQNGQLVFLSLSFAFAYLLVLATFFGVALIFTAKTIYRGTIQIGASILGSAILTMLAFTAMSNAEIVTNNLQLEGPTEAANKAAENVIVPLIETVFRDVSSVGQIVSGIFVVIGVLLIVLGFVLKKRYREKIESSNQKNMLTEDDHEGFLDKMHEYQNKKKAEAKKTPAKASATKTVAKPASKKTTAKKTPAKKASPKKPSPSKKIQ